MDRIFTRTTTIHRGDSLTLVSETDLTLHHASNLSEALQDAIHNARRRLGDSCARILFIAPSKGSVQQLRRTLGNASSFIRVDFWTPEQLISSLGTLGLVRCGLRPEPPGWMQTFLRTRIPELVREGQLGPHAETLLTKGWYGSIERALGELQSAQVSVDALKEYRDDPVYGERFALLSSILGHVETARSGEQMYTFVDVEGEALKHARCATHLPCRTVQAVVVVGDRVLSKGTYEALSAWLKGRDVSRIAVSPFEQLKPVPYGLRQVASDAHRITVRTDSKVCLGRIRSDLFQRLKHHFSSQTDEDPEGNIVHVASVPDEVREITEAVRIVQRAIQSGIALDQIAIVLPNPECADLLDMELERASIPAVWLTASSLRRVPCARFLLLCLAAVQGEHSAEMWYTLLTQSGLIGIPRKGRSRWRSILQGCPDDGTYATIVQHIALYIASAQKSEDTKAQEAAESLHASLTALHDALFTFPQHAPLHQHARAWRLFLEGWWKRDPAHRRVLELLKSLQGGPSQLTIHVQDAASIFSDLLQGTQFLRGSLAQQKIRILPPMGVLGASFDFICVTGLCEGTFPRTPRENPLLTDSMIRILREDLDASLLDPDQQYEMDRRRLAAIFSGAVRHLWMSYPRTSLLDKAPQLPGRLLLEILEARFQRRIRFHELPSIVHTYALRSEPFPKIPSHALGQSEHLIARVLSEPERAIHALTTHPDTRRLISMHRAVDRSRIGSYPLTGSQWGWIDPNLFSLSLDETPISPQKLSLLIQDPRAYILRHVLQAYPPVKLKRSSWDFSKHGIKVHAHEIFANVLQHSSLDLTQAQDLVRFRAQFEEAWNIRLKELSNTSMYKDPIHTAIWREEGSAVFDHFAQTLASQHTHTVERSEKAHIQDGSVQVDLSTSTQGNTRLGSTELFVLRTTKASQVPKLDQPHVHSAVLRALALQNLGESISHLTFIDSEGKKRSVPIHAFEKDVCERLQIAKDALDVGWWPSGSVDTTLSFERESRTKHTQTMEHRRDVLKDWKAS